MLGQEKFLTHYLLYLLISYEILFLFFSCGWHPSMSQKLACSIESLEMGELHGK